MLFSIVTPRDFKAEIQFKTSSDSNKFFIFDTPMDWLASKRARIEQDLSPGYTGIRPNLEGIDDFIVDINSFNEGVVVNILGYSSPGLTSSLALSKLVESRLSDYIN